MSELVIFLISLIAVIYGSDWLGSASIELAKKLALPRILIGATFVSLATTLPEITIAGFSASAGEADIGIGTAFGSPIVNLGLILGILLLFSKAQVNKKYYIRTVQILLAALVLVFLISITGISGAISGFILFLFGIIYLAIEFLLGRHENGLVEKIESNIDGLKEFFFDGKSFYQVFYLIAGATLLLIGAHFLVKSTAVLAAVFGIPELVIGIFVIALGTSLPEAITAINSVIKNRDALSTGNLFGASILDLTFAFGLVSFFGGIKIDQIGLSLSIGTIAALAIISLLPIFTRLGHKKAGLLLILFYFIFITWFVGIEL